MEHSCFLEEIHIHIADLTSTSALPQPSIKVLSSAKKTNKKTNKNKQKKQKKGKNKKRKKKQSEI
uniref:Macaca fascicularis brain cDNA, clone: QtrA-17190 n=1 Tax=Macaca fascicularis TaxID=9541 RepID=I7GAZ4_MACFA|nr:unnamed protein product [Macaca fascicularis]